ncbi:Ig-like domain-containing protein [Nocardioides rubriscoriae]|uniref:Ig-like domain-containing protein n=1 Tax=Nocardioides rubriscoriae TaxID=642762 RepID=UPI0011DF12B1|nr:Ig-like domain-containing protein [Nocardioides rubriscoriae]
MNVRPKKTLLAASALAMAVAATGVAGVAAGAGSAGRDASDWYTGANATVPDANKTAVPLKLYDAAGNQVTTGSTTAPLATYVAADTAVRADDQFASLLVHLPLKSTAPGAWPGVQASGTDKFTGAGAVTAPASLSGKPFVRTAGGYSLADVAGNLPNPESASDSFVGVYELRLRTSSATAGVADQYAATYLKVSGSTWTVTTAPVLGGDGPDPQPVSTTVAPTWPARITYGTAANVAVTVSPASGTATPTGTVRLVTGSTTLSQTTLSASGTATLPISRTALVPGSRVLKVVYDGSTGAFTGSESAPRTYAVAKAAPGRPTFKATKVPTSTRTGKATLTVPTPAGLAKAAGKAVVTIKKAGSTKKVTATIAAGAGSVTLPKLAPGTWTVTVSFQGSTFYLPSTSTAYRLRTKG